MPAQNLIVMRRDTDRIIADDPWACTIYKKGRRVEDGESTWTFTGTLKSFGPHGATWLNQGQLPGEDASTRHGWICVAPWNVSVPKMGAEIKMVQASTGSERWFTVFHGQQYAYKMEIVMDERQA